jgi:hypothetical protein
MSLLPTDARKLLAEVAKAWLCTRTDRQERLVRVLELALRPRLFASHHFNDDTAHAPHIHLAANIKEHLA